MRRVEDRQGREQVRIEQEDDHKREERRPECLRDDRSGHRNHPDNLPEAQEKPTGQDEESDRERPEQRPFQDFAGRGMSQPPSPTPPPDRPNSAWRRYRGGSRRPLLAGVVLETPPCRRVTQMRGGIFRPISLFLTHLFLFLTQFDTIVPYRPRVLPAGRNIRATRSVPRASKRRGKSMARRSRLTQEL